MRLRSLSKLLIGALVVIGAAASIAAPAGAVTTASATPNPIPVTADQTSATMTVSWTGAVSQQLMYVDICKKSTFDPTFDVSVDCSPLGSANPNGTASGSGTLADYPVFRGADPGEGAWGCFAPGDTAPAGIQKFTTCFVRVTDTSIFNSVNAKEVPFTFVVSDGVIPEAPLTILLPVVGTLAALGGFILVRRRQISPV